MSLIEVKRKHRGRKKTLRHVFDALHAPHSNLLSSSRPEFTRGTRRAPRRLVPHFSQTSGYPTIGYAIGVIVPRIRTFLPTSIYFSCRCRRRGALAYIHLMPPTRSFIWQTDQRRVLSTDKLLERSHPLTARRTNLWISETSRTRLLDRKQPANMEFLGPLPLIPISCFPALGFCFLISRFFATLILF